MVEEVAAAVVAEVANKHSYSRRLNMNHKSLMLVAVALIVSMFSCVTAYQIKVKHKLERMAVAKSVDNWQWEQEWPDAPKVPEVVEEPKENPPVEDKTSQIVAENYKDALKKAKEHNKTIFAFFEADWCSACKKMESETLSNNAVKEAIKEHILVIINVDRNRDLVRKYDMRAIPAYMILDKNEKVLKSDKGFKDSDEFVKWLTIGSIPKTSIKSRMRL